MNEPTPAGSKAKVESILALARKKRRVELSGGPLFVRRRRVSDVNALDGSDPAAVGRRAVQIMVNSTESPDDDSGLPDETLDALSEEDLQKLIAEVSVYGSWGDLGGERSFAALGSRIISKLAKEAQHSKELLDSLRTSVKTKYSFLNDDTVQRLQDQMAQLTTSRALLSQSVRDSIKDIGIASHLASMVDAVPQMEFTRPPIILTPEETALGKATLQSARNSEVVAQKVAVLAEVVGGINQTLVVDVLPAWFNQVKAAQASARKQLWVAVIAIVVPVLVSAAVQGYATYWQTQEQKAAAATADEYQQRLHSLLLEQLKAQRQALEEQRTASERLREEVRALRQPRAVPLPESKASN